MLSAELKDKIALSGGNLKDLTREEQAAYYIDTCERNKLDPSSSPFSFLAEGGKLKLYLNKGGANQLNKIHEVSHKIISRETFNGCYVVTACAYTKDRQTECIGAVAIQNANGQLLSGDSMANAMMKAETKAKRRATIDLLGIGVLDETEVETIAGAQTYQFKDVAAGAIPGNGQPPHGISELQPQHNQPSQTFVQGSQQNNMQSATDFKKKIDTVKELQEFISLAKSAKDLAQIYFVNAELIESDPQLKQAVTALKASFFNSPVAINNPDTSTKQAMQMDNRQNVNAQTAAAINNAAAVTGNTGAASPYCKTYTDASQVVTILDMCKTVKQVAELWSYNDKVQGVGNSNDVKTMFANKRNSLLNA